MTVTETLNQGLKRSYSLTIESMAITAKVDKAIAEVAPKVRMPGFRPGKVPANLVRKMHGESLRREAVSEAINDAVNGMIAEKGLRPATQPQIDLESGTADGEDVMVTVALEILPAVPDAAIDGITLERFVVEPSEADIDAALEKLAAQQKSFEDAPAKHKAAIGDLVVMDYVGTVAGEAFEGGTGEAMEIELGTGRLIPGFEEQLVGAKAGDKRTVKLAFPADYGAENLAGKDAEFAVTVSAVKTAKLALVDDTLATNLGLESLEKLREILKDQVEAELSGLTRTHLKRKLLDHLAAAHDFEVPPSMVDAEFAQIWQQVTADADDAAKVELEAERADYVRIAERRVRLGLLLSDIGQKNGVQITNQEMTRLVQQEASRFPGQERDVQKYFAENAMAAAQLRAPLFEEKVVDFLLGKAAVTDRSVTRAELEAAIESDDETPTSHAHAGHGAGHVHGPDCDHDHADAKPAAKKPAAAKKPKATAAELVPVEPAAAEAVAAEAVATESGVTEVVAAEAVAEKPVKKATASKPAADGDAPAPAKKAPAKKKIAE